MSAASGVGGMGGTPGGSGNSGSRSRRASAVLVLRDTRRAGGAALAAVPAVLAVGALLAAVLAMKGTAPDTAVGFWLREVLPLPFGLVVAAVPAAESCLETQLSLPVPMTRTLGRRAGLCVGWSALGVLAFALVALAVGAWHPAHGPVAGQLTWLSPAVALAGVGALVFALSGSTTGAAAAVASLWLVQDLTPQWYVAHAWTRPLYLFADDAAGRWSGEWWVNRLGLAGAGALLIGVAAVTLTVRQERVLAGRLRKQGDDS